jgi:hypothetical protein
VSQQGKLRLNFHAGQIRAWQSNARTVAVLAGTQGGKTVFGPPWLYREIQARGPGDYLVVTPTYPLLALKALPEFLRFFKRLLRLGEYVGSPSKCFTFSADGARRTFGAESDIETHVYFGHASDPDSLESATGKAAWLDEAGQKKFKLGSLEAVDRRLAIYQGRKLITTTPYDLGWLKQKIWDRWKAGDKWIDVIRFDSTENPAFPREEFERARAQLPRWKFDLYYRAIFTRPAGLIYDCFDDSRHKIPRFEIPPEWPRYLGLDFGGVNTAGVFYAEEPGTKRLFAYREYKAGGRTARGHTEAIRRGEPRIPYCVGGAKSEDQWRDEFCAAGLPVSEPGIADVELGIDRVYGAHQRGEIMVFEDLDGYLEEKLTYSRETDDAGEVTEEIDDKHSFHFMDAERYIIGFLRPTIQEFQVGVPKKGKGGIVVEAPAGVFNSGGQSGQW